MPKDGFVKLNSAQLHHFIDASESGYGVVTYLQLIVNRETHVTFSMLLMERDHRGTLEILNMDLGHFCPALPEELSHFPSELHLSEGGKRSYKQVV